jgi:thymidine phosphorylase
LGGGRVHVTDVIDPHVGLVWHKQAGEEVRAGETLCEIHHRNGKGLAECQAYLTAALSYDAPVAPLVRCSLRV